MKKILTAISALAVMIGLSTSCQKEQNSSARRSPVPANEVVIKATISDAATKVSFTEDVTNNKLKTAWETDDRIVGWDAAGNAIELQIASIENNNTAIFKTVEGSAAIPTSGKVYMIYAPGKSKANISNKTLEYDLSNQGGGKLPALMTATGEVSNNVLALNFNKRLAIVAVKNPTFPVTAATTITGLRLSGSNILTKVTFRVDQNGALVMESSVSGVITRGCNFTTAADGTSEATVYFAVLPNGTAADVTVSTTDPEGYQILFPGKSFTEGQCFMLDQKNINKQTFTVTVTDDITNGTITTSHSDNVAWDTEVTVTVTPDEGYELDAITVKDADGADVPVTNGKFIMPQSAVTISGTFRKKDLTIMPTGTESSGTYTVTGGTYTIKKGTEDVTTVKMGDEITVTATPAVGYELDTITVKDADGADVPVTNGKFTMPAKAVTISVTFKAQAPGTTPDYDITTW